MLIEMLMFYLLAKISFKYYIFAEDMDKKDSDNSVLGCLGAAGTSIIGLLIFLTIIGFIMYSMDSCMSKIL